MLRVLVEALIAAAALFVVLAGLRMISGDPLSVQWAATRLAASALAVLVAVALYYHAPLRWDNKLPAKRFNDVRDEFGFPTHLVRGSRGLAVWEELPSPFVRIELRDEQTPHCCPKPHHDFLYASVRVNIPRPDLLGRVLSLSKSVWYDQLNHLLWARCHFMGANVATLRLATNILLGRPSEDYGTAVMASMHPSNYKRQLAQLTENLRRLPAAAEAVECAGGADCSSIFSG